MPVAVLSKKQGFRNSLCILRFVRLPRFRGGSSLNACINRQLWPTGNSWNNELTQLRRNHITLTIFRLHSQFEANGRLLSERSKCGLHNRN